MYLGQDDEAFVCEGTKAKAKRGWYKACKLFPTPAHPVCNSGQKTESALQALKSIDWNSACLRFCSLSNIVMEPLNFGYV